MNISYIPATEQYAGTGLTAICRRNFLDWQDMEQEGRQEHSNWKEMEDDIRVAWQLDHLYRIQAEGTPADLINVEDIMEEDEIDKDNGNDMLEVPHAYMPLGERGSQLPEEL